MLGGVGAGAGPTGQSPATRLSEFPFFGIEIDAVGRLFFSNLAASSAEEWRQAGSLSYQGLRPRSVATGWKPVVPLNFHGCTLSKDDRHPRSRVQAPYLFDPDSGLENAGIPMPG